MVRVPLAPYPSSGVGAAGCAAAAVATATTDAVDAVAIVNMQQVHGCNNRQS